LARNQVNSASSIPESSESKARRSFPWTTGFSSGSSGMVGPLTARTSFANHQVNAKNDLTEEDGGQKSNRALVDCTEAGDNRCCPPGYRAGKLQLPLEDDAGGGVGCSD
jgi:hypothetical protein